MAKKMKRQSVTTFHKPFRLGEKKTKRVTPAPKPVLTRRPQDLTKRNIVPDRRRLDRLEAKVQQLVLRVRALEGL